MKTKFLTLLFLTSIASLSTQAQETSGSAELAPKIVCDEPLFDFGEKNNTEFVEHSYQIRNTGTLSLEIRNVRASCGCTAVKPSQDVVAPGSEASIMARLDLRGRNGFQQKSITDESNDPQTPNLILTLKGNAVEPLRAQPSSLFFGRIASTDERRRTFEIISGQGPIQIVSTRTDNAALVVSPVESEAGGDGTIHRFQLILDSNLPEGNVSGTVFVKTDMPNQPEVSIPVAAYIAAAPETAPAAETPAP